jgi:hypothetical protein
LERSIDNSKGKWGMRTTFFIQLPR